MVGDLADPADFWQAQRWVGLITRLQTAQASTMKNHHGSDERIHMAQLIVVPATHASWGYGLYVHPGVSIDAVKKVVNQFMTAQERQSVAVAGAGPGQEVRVRDPFRERDSGEAQVAGHGTLT